MSALSSFRRRLMAGAYPKEQPNYLCFTALEDGTFTFTIAQQIDATDCEYVEYSTDGVNWVRTNNVANTEVTITTPTILEGDKVLWRGIGYKYSNGYYHSIFSSSGNYKVGGNIASLIYGKNFTNATEYKRRYGTSHGSNRSIFQNLFKGCETLIDASELVLPNIGFNYNTASYYGLFEGCTNLQSASFELPTVVSERNSNNQGQYQRMFYNCSSLVYPPMFNMAGLNNYQCFGMFYNCTSLTIAPDLTSITSAANYCFGSMFYGCSGITLPARMRQFTTVYDGCFSSMYEGCTNLTTAPVLPAETLATSCYYFMFMRCSSITWVKMLATDISASGCLNRWMENTKNTSDCVFVKHINAQWTTTGNSGVPNKWTIIYYDPSVDKYYTDQTRATECDDHGNPI